MPVTQRSCVFGPREQKPGTLKEGGYSLSGNVHENDIQFEMLSSILYSSITPAAYKYRGNSVRSGIGNVPGNSPSMLVWKNGAAPDGELHSKGRSFARRARYPQCAAMRLDNGARDRQAHACARQPIGLRAPAEEFFKDQHLFRDRNACATICNMHRDDPAVSGRSEGDRPIRAANTSRHFQSNCKTPSGATFHQRERGAGWNHSLP